ncbi:expansin EXLX1 family cellulose-binding protein [Cryptosporangium aurantiacum]|uniref:Pollen allergen n=1 Tax=Cryptosporangium aurantiacum TaxID=134849 RepID=A0A1M7MWR5_9ACTN|nr:expansin EXLX1 family cellulose-binding protein [Cryptosporangium aurantiacum]SHM95064.1 Pollen allergen [Cryptosporangium aurantiacum]
MTRPRRDDGTDDARDLLAETDFFGAPRSRDGGAKARSWSENTGELRAIADPASGRGRHRDPEPRRRSAPGAATGAIAGALEARASGPLTSERAATPSFDTRSPRPTAGTAAGAGGSFAGAGGSFAGAGGSFAGSAGAVGGPAGFQGGGAGGASADTQLIARQPAANSATGRLAGLRRLFRRRWFAPSLTGGAVLCSVAFVTGVAQFAGTACAAVLPAGVETTGQATFYDGGTGNCSYPTLPADDLYVALGPDAYSDAAACGGYLDVTGPSGSVRVKVVDQCPECAADHIDLSRTAFARIADPEAGLVPVTFKAVADPAVPANLSVRVKEGSSAFWLALLIDNHGNPLTKVEVSASGTAFTALSRTSFNYWVAEGGVGDGPFSVRVTDNAGRTATIPNVTLSPGTVQESAVAIGDGTLSAPPSNSPTPKASTTTRSAGSPQPADAESTTDATLAAAAGSSDQTENQTDTAVTPDADASEEIAANPAPSSSLAVPRAAEATAKSTGRNSCG